MALRLFRGLAEHSPHRRDHPLPLPFLGRQLSLAGTSQRVMLDPTALFVQRPLAADPSFVFQSVQSREERPRGDDKGALRDLTDPVRHRDAVLRLELERPQDKEIQRPA